MQRDAIPPEVEIRAKSNGISASIKFIIILTASFV